MRGLSCSRGLRGSIGSRGIDERLERPGVLQWLARLDRDERMDESAHRLERLELLEPLDRGRAERLDREKRV